MRSLLIVGDGSAAGSASGADALILDAAAAAALPVAAGGPAIFVRLPPLDAPDALGALEAAARLKPRGVALPLAAGGGDVQRLGARLAVQEAVLGLADGSIGVLAFATESPEAIFGLSSYRGASARLAGLIWSAAPLDAALRAAPRRRDAADGPLRLARNLALYAARAAGVLALDAPFPEVADLQGLRAEAIAARDDGFDGKAALDPAQAAVINAIFSAR